MCATHLSSTGNPTCPEHEWELASGKFTQGTHGSVLQTSTCMLAQLPLHLQPQARATWSPGFSSALLHITIYCTNSRCFWTTGKGKRRNPSFPKEQHSLQGTAELFCLKKEWFKTQHFPLMLTSLDVTLIKALWMVDVQPYVLLLKSREIKDV